MSIKSSSTPKSQLEPEAMLNDLDDLDYEPDANSDLDEDELFELSHNHFSFNGQSAIYKMETPVETPTETPTSSVKSFRLNMNYRSMHVGVTPDSFRNNYGAYLQDSYGAHLDSSDDEGDSELQFDFGHVADENKELDDYAQSESQTDQLDSNNVNSQRTKNVFSDDTSDYENQNFSDSILLSPVTCQMIAPHAPLLEKSYGDNPVFRHELKSPSSASVVQEEPRKKAPNFTIQVKGNQRFCLGGFSKPLSFAPNVTRSTKKTSNKWKLWKIKMKSNLPSLRSTDEVIRYSEEKNTIESESRGSDMSGSEFKVPLKRPPTRQKSSSLAESGVKMVRETEDDIISLIASTTIGVDDDCDSLFLKSEPRSLDSLASTEKMSRIAEWVGRTEKNKPTFNNDYKKVPPVYRGLCYAFFLTNQCNGCNKSHLIEPGHQRKLETSEPQRLLTAYEFAKSNQNFFAKVYRVFGDIFASRDCKGQLIDMIEMLLENPNFDSKVEGVNAVLKQLQRCKSLGIFEDAVEYVRNKVNGAKYPMLGEILIEIIISSENLPKNWPILRKMCNIGEKIPQRLVAKLLINLMKNPVNCEVCRELLQHIKEHECQNLASVPANIREPFLKICKTRTPNSVSNDDELEASIEYNLRKQRIRFEKEKRNSAVPATYSKVSNNSTAPPNGHCFSGAAFDFSVPPPGFGKAVLPQRTNNNAQSYLRGFNFSLPKGSVDFAALSRQQVTFNAEQNQSDVVPFFTPPSPHLSCISRPRKGSSGSELSAPNLTDTESNGEDRLGYGNSQSESRGNNPAAANVRTGFTYNREGLQYDPANDYFRLPKRRRVHSNVSDTTVSQVFGREPRTAHASQLVQSSQDGVPERTSSVAGDVDDRAVAWQSNRTPEDLVTSSSEPAARNQKAPEHPLFGRIYFDPNYDFNVSLHNSYLQRIDNVDIDEEDVHKLNECVKNGNAELFLDLLTKYAVPTTVQNFISMTLAHLKGTNQMVARTYQRLLASIERTTPFYYGDLKIRVVLEVVTMNLLFELERRTMFNEIKDLLMKFPDWDSLITSRLFITDTHTAVSIVGRYLFIAKLLVYSCPELTYEILICPNLHLLEESYKWPYHPPTSIPEICGADLDHRNIVLKKFLQQGFHLSTVSVIQLYKAAFKRKNGIWKFDVRPFVNPMILYLINNRKTAQLKQINNDLNIFINLLERNILKGFLVVMADQLPKEGSFRILEYCMTKDIYQKMVLNDALVYIIEIKTSMTDQEIDLLVLYYFHKLLEVRSLPPRNQPLKFEIVLPGSQINQTLLPNVLHHNRSVLDTNAYLKWVLLNKIGIHAISKVLTTVEIPKEALANYLAS